MARFALAMASCVLAFGAAAQIPAPGTFITNTATSTQQVGASVQSSTSNPVSLVVGGPGATFPVLSKAFGASVIGLGGSTSLTFRLTNSLGNPAQAGIAFTDTLPAGLRLTPTATASFAGAGCAGTVTLVQPSQVSVSAGTMAPGTATCDVIVNGVTNAAPAGVNASCTGNPPAFTNGPGAISGLANANNGVTNQCLVVDGVLNVTATPVCVRDTPYVDYTVTPVGVAAPMGVTIDWMRVGGGTVSTLPNQPLTGRLLWPGAAVDGNGNPTAWPGWTLVNGEFVPVADGLRPDMRIAFTVNPTTTVVVSYPPATPACNANPPVGGPNLHMGLIKSITPDIGMAPSGPHTVHVRYMNTAHFDGLKNDVTLSDILPAGMTYVPGSLRVAPQGANPVAMPQASGTAMLHGGPASYQTTAGSVSVTIAQLPVNEWGMLEFDVLIGPQVAAGTTLQNTARVTYQDGKGGMITPRPSNVAEFRVVGTEGVTLRGQTLATAAPGSEVTFENVLTNTGNRTDTFDITLAGSDYPAGTVFRLYKPDGVALLADTNGNGVADTGPVAAGGTYRIIVRAQLPNGVSGGPFAVTKRAQSVSNAQVGAADRDVVSAIASVCRVTLEPDNSGRVAPGGTLVYTHVLTNVGNCTESISFPAAFMTSSATGWIAQVFVDNPQAGGQSLVGVVDAGDQLVSAATQFTLAPGATATLLVRVTAPAGAASGSTASATIRLNGGNSGSLANTDRTTVEAGSGGTITDTITGFIDPGFLRPTIWGFIDKPLYLRANAPSCNADPTVIERRTIIITGPNGEREEIVAVETGPNTGMFVAEPLMVRRPPVTAGDKILEGRPYDSFHVDLVGCGRKISTTVTLIDPNGVVFDSRTNEPVAGATVRLVTASGATCSNTPASVSALVMGQVVAAPNVVVTGADGRFDFPLVAPGDYCVLVTPPNGYTWASTVPAGQLPPGRNILATGPTSGGSYGQGFRVGQETGPVIVDVPVDGGAMGGLFVQKTVLRSVVEIGEFLDYNINVRNGTGFALNQASVMLTDNLPAGFTYVGGSARIDGKPAADPAGGAGPVLVFSLGTMARDQQIRVSYRVRVGPGAMQGDGVNRVMASYRAGGGSTLYSESNVATARVQIVGGVFSDRGYVIGKVFADCQPDGVQRRGEAGPAEVGVPGVRLYLEDGTNVITDSEGKFSIYGLLPRTHVLKVDRTTLPSGVGVRDMGITTSRNLGKADSLIIDLKSGELHKANFTITRCSEPVMAEIKRRRSQAASDRAELEGRLQQRLETDPNLRAASDVKALPASGVVGATAPTATVAAPAALGAAVDGPAATAAGRFDTFARPLSEAPRDPLKPALPPRAKPAEEALESLLPAETNALGFMGLADGATLPFAQATVRVKGTAGGEFKLLVNGNEVPADRIGKRAVLAEKQVQAWEFLGVNLRAGENVLTLKQFDQFGNARGEKAIKVLAPGSAARIVFELPATGAGAMADGRTPARVTVRMTDEKGVPVTARTMVSLFTTLGRWTAEDLVPLEPGVQVAIEGGRAEFEILPPAEPGEAQLRAVSGDIVAESRLDFLPDLRQMIAAGVIEGVLNLRKMDAKGFQPARAQDGFEQEITHLSRSWSDGKRDAGARAAMFLKGKVRGDYLLTMAYDSDKNTRERLFRDIQPDEFYPVYGDASTRGFDAQSTGRFYVRVDKARSYLLYGDYNTAQLTEARKLSNYNRSLTGLKHHYESDGISANLFASRDSSRQVIDELPANGTSGPFLLSRSGGLVNSEKIEVLTRNRNQPSVILRVVPLARFVDYELEPLTGRILLKAPVPSLDENLNPVSLRITYEIDQGGADFWVAGGDVQVKLGKTFEVGAMYVEDRNPLDKFRMAGVNAIARLSDRTFLVAEVAGTERDTRVGGTALGKRDGEAARVEFRHAGSRLDVTLYAGRAAAGFDNPGGSLGRGREEAGGKLAFKVDEKTRILAEVLHTEDVVSNTRRDGMMVSAERTFDNGMKLEAGLRHAKDSQQAATAAAAPAGAVRIPDEVTSARLRLTGNVPGLKDATAYVEGEVDVEDASRRMAAVGGDYRLPNGGRVYARHEFITSLTGPYGLSDQQRQNATVVGLSTDYVKDGTLFSEYRVRDAISGGDAEVALGLRNTWRVADGLALQTGFERIHAIAGKGDAEATAMTFGIEYTANPLWKGSARLELRDGTTSDSMLSTVAAAAKMSRDWTFLARNTYSLIKNKGQSSGRNEQDRLQAGVAYRDTEEDRWNGLARVEHRAEHDTTQVGIELKRTVELISIHANWQPRRPFTFGARYAAKWATERSNGVRTRNDAQLISGRATWDFAPRWDVSLNASTLLGKGTQSRQYGLGLELGFMVMENLWISGGYNVFGYKDEDLASGEYTSKGGFIRLRYKFDEDLFGKARAVPAASAGTSRENGTQAAAAFPVSGTSGEKTQ